MGRRTVDRKVGAQPPENLEKIVRWLVPAASREHVLGDLNERYRSPGKYLVDALCVLARSRNSAWQSPQPARCLWHCFSTNAGDWKESPTD
jgi:hypothetical protein